MGKSIDDEDARAEALRLLAEGVNVGEVAERTKLARSTLYRLKREAVSEEASSEEAGEESGEFTLEPDPLARFAGMLREYGVPAKKREWAVSQAKRDPSLLRVPGELARLLSEGIGVAPYPVERFVRAFLGTPLQAQAFPGYYAQAWGTQPWAGQGPWQQPPLTPRDIKDMVEEAVRRNLPQQEAPRDLEEVQEPMLDGEGRPLAGPDGTPMMRWRRVPLRQGGSVPPELAASLDRIRKENARILSKLEAEQVRRQEAERYASKLDGKEKELRDAEAGRARAEAGLPADAQIIKTGIEEFSKTVALAQRNIDTRLDRLERVGLRVLVPQQEGQPVPFKDADLEALAARQALIDAREAEAAGAAAAAVPDPGPVKRKGAAPEPAEDAGADAAYH